MHQRIKAIGFYTADIDMTEIENKYISKNAIQEFCESKAAAKELSDEFFAHRRGRYYSYKMLPKYKKALKLSTKTFVKTG